jgi:iron complex outermembrane receptor protein
MRTIFSKRGALFVSTAVAAALTIPLQAQAQEAGDDEGGLTEIIVTAQKREQSLQDVPIAVTAVTGESLQANRIFSVNDLSGLAPGMTVKPSPGGSSVPVFTIRGQSSYGVVPGSDKQVSIYIDGVYVGSPRGSIFEMPDIQRIEVLRGPQGTLFGRNATAGAISVTTRDPTGEAHVKVEGSLGNRDAYRFRITADTPQIGPFSAYGSFVRNYRRGEVRNLDAGLVWVRPQPFGTQLSAPYLGTVDSESFFGSVKFEPSDRFKMVYKYDRNVDRGTPDVTGVIGIDPNYPGLSPAAFGLVAPLLNAIYADPANNVFAAPDGLRPDVARNGFVTARRQKVYGHNLTATWQATDDISVKNIFAYRRAEVLGPTPIDGYSPLTVPNNFSTALALGAYLGFNSIGPGGFSSALGVLSDLYILDANFNPTGINPNSTLIPLAASLAGQRFLGVAAQSASISRQWSDELQVNYTSEKLNATVGAMWFHSKDTAGGPAGSQNTLANAIVPNSGVIPLGNRGDYANEATSIAAYAQVEFKVTPELEVVAGARITRDSKKSTFTYNSYLPAFGIVTPDAVITPPDFRQTKPSFLIGLNWTPNDDTLVYAKYSNSFVSGGSTGGLPYQAETANSYEIGIKADFFDSRLRTNLALFHVDYNHFQQSQSTSASASAALALPILTQLYGAAVANAILPKLSVFVGDQGKVRAKGFELEVTAAPTRGLTLGGSLSYIDISYPFVEPAVLAANGGVFNVAARPEWTGSLWASYETQPIAGDMTLSLRADSFYQGGMVLASNPAQITQYNRGAEKVDGYFIVNGRVALKRIPIGPISGELAVWGKNLTDRRDITTALFTPYSPSASYVPARTFGVDMSIEF